MEMEHASVELFHIGPVPVYSETVTAWGIMLLLVLISILATRKMQQNPKGLQNFIETVVEGLLNFLSGVMGESRARETLPLLGTFFIFILLSNYSGLLPGSGEIPGLKAPTSNLNITASLAIVVFFSVHYYGFKKKGFRYLHHFIEPYAPFLPLNIIEELAKPLSLSLRLFGNVFGEELIIAVLLGLVPMLLPIPMMALGLLTGAIQAFVFTILATTYITNATEAEH